MKILLSSARYVLLTAALVIGGSLIVGVYNYLHMLPRNLSTHAPMKDEDLIVDPAMYQLKALQKTRKERPVRVLSVDGGGTRGLIPARVLQELEKKTGQPIAELFDLLIGSSSGAITVSVLTLPDEQGRPQFSAQDVVDLYMQNSGKIFYAPWLHRIMSLNGLIAPKYLAESKHEVFEARAGDAKFSDLMKPVMIPALDYVSVKPVLFRNWVSDSDYFIADILSGATSPPAIFAPITIQSLDHKHEHVLVDGAMFLDSPAIEAWIQANQIFPNHEFIIVSLGTGYINPKTFTPASRDWGLLQWSSELMSLLLSSHIRFVDHRMDELVRVGDFAIADYYRFNLPVNVYSANAFSGTPETLAKINEYADRLIDEQQEQLDEVANRLMTVDQ